MKIAAGQFKAQCLKLMDDVARRRHEIIVTKRGKPVARLVPVNAKSERVATGPWGWLEGSVEMLDDLIAPVEEKWSADE